MVNIFNVLFSNEYDQKGKKNIQKFFPMAKSQNTYDLSPH